jgi:hypothetical protein
MSSRLSRPLLPNVPAKLLSVYSPSPYGFSLAGLFSGFLSLFPHIEPLCAGDLSACHLLDLFHDFGLGDAL